MPGLERLSTNINMPLRLVISHVTHKNLFCTAMKKVSYKGSVGGFVPPVMGQALSTCFEVL